MQESNSNSAPRHYPEKYVRVGFRKNRILLSRVILAKDDWTAVMRLKPMEHKRRTERHIKTVPPHSETALKSQSSERPIKRVHHLSRLFECGG